MKKIVQQNLIDEYYNHFPLIDYFNFDIRPYVSIVQFESDEVIMQEGTATAYLYYLINGRAKLFLSHENGRISLINFLNAPCFIGEMELIGAQNTSNGITAITECTCYAINTSSCKHKILEDIRFYLHHKMGITERNIQNHRNFWGLHIDIFCMFWLILLSAAYLQKPIVVII